MSRTAQDCYENAYERAADDLYDRRRSLKETRFALNALGEGCLLGDKFVSLTSLAEVIAADPDDHCAIGRALSGMVTAWIAQDVSAQYGVEVRP